MDWKARIAERRKVEAAFKRADAMAKVKKKALTEFDTALLADIEQVKGAAGEDPYIIVSGRQYGLDHKDKWSIKDKPKVAQMLAEAGFVDLLAPMLGEVRTALSTGVFEDEKFERRVQRLLVNTPVPYLADRKAK